MGNRYNSRGRHKLMVIRVTPTEHAELRARATGRGLTLSDYLRTLAGLPTGDAREDLSEKKKPR